MLAARVRRRSTFRPSGPSTIASSAGRDPTGTTELSMTLRAAAGVNLPSSATRIVPVPGRWTALAVAADVPEKIGAAAVKFVMPMLAVVGFKPGEKVYFDDLMLYRLEE